MTFNALQRRGEQRSSVSVFCRWLLQQQFDNDLLLFRRRYVAARLADRVPTSLVLFQGDDHPEAPGLRGSGDHHIPGGPCPQGPPEEAGQEEHHRRFLQT